MNSFTLLLVDDNPADVRLVEEAVREWKTPSTVHKLADGERALDFLYRRNGYEGAPRPDMVFLDLRIPKRDGFDVLQTIKEDPKLRGIPVIVFATKPPANHVQRIYELQANALVLKPLLLDEFFEAIQKTGEYWQRVAHLPGADRA